MNQLSSCDFGSARLFQGWVALPLPPSSGRDCRYVPADISHAADSRLSRTMAESSPPSSRVRTAADPDTTLDIAAKSWPSEAAGGPLYAVPGSGLPQYPTRILYCDRFYLDPSRPGAPSLASLSGIGKGGVGRWIPPVGLLHLNHGCLSGPHLWSRA